MKSHSGNVKMKLYDVDLKRSISSDARTSSMISVFSRCENLSSQFFDLDIENTLGGGTLAKIQLSLYDFYRADRL
jgi:hypothetical protein